MTKQQTKTRGAGKFAPFLLWSKSHDNFRPLHIFFYVGCSIYLYLFDGYSFNDSLARDYYFASQNPYYDNVADMYQLPDKKDPYLNAIYACKFFQDKDIYTDYEFPPDITNADMENVKRSSEFWLDYDTYFYDYFHYDLASGQDFINALETKYTRSEIEYYTSKPQMAIYYPALKNEALIYYARPTVLYRPHYYAYIEFSLELNEKITPWLIQNSGISWGLVDTNDINTLSIMSDMTHVIDLSGITYWRSNGLSQYGFPAYEPSREDLEHNMMEFDEDYTNLPMFRTAVDCFAYEAVNPYLYVESGGIEPEPFWLYYEFYWLAHISSPFNRPICHNSNELNRARTDLSNSMHSLTVSHLFIPPSANMQDCHITENYSFCYSDYDGFALLKTVMLLMTAIYSVFVIIPKSKKVKR